MMSYSYRPRKRAAYLADPIFRGLSLRQLEVKAKVPRMQIARLLKGEPSPDRIMNALTSALKCRPSDLLKVIQLSKSESLRPRRPCSPRG